MSDAWARYRSARALRVVASETFARRRQDAVRRRRARPVIALATGAFVVGAVAGASHGPDEAQTVAVRFVSAWTHEDYATMYSLVDARTQQRLSVTAFADLYRQALRTATARELTRTGSPPGRSNDAIVVPVRVRTRVFGTLGGSLPIAIDHSSAPAKVSWSPTLLFPGLHAGERLTRRTELPSRAALLAHDGTMLAFGPAPPGTGHRNSALGRAGTAVAGSTGPARAAERDRLSLAGLPAGAVVGVSGLERALDDRLRGSPGGQLLAGTRVLAATPSRAGAVVRTTILPAVQRAAVSALGGQLGGVVALRPATGEILAVAGLGIDDLQPPGSTFKIITLTAALEAGLARAGTRFPEQTGATLNGVTLANANGESCGGALAHAFAVSCNSVFAPLGARVGATRLVATARRFGFDEPVGVEGAVQSTVPPAARIADDLAVGSTAIGQGEVQASVLQMTTVAATIADDGMRPRPSFLAARPAPETRARVTSPGVAHTVRRMMIDVVRAGTGTAAAIAGVTVAGKTGTAELTSTSSSCPATPLGTAADCQSAQNDPSNTDAWFVCFAPALAPRVAVGVLLVKDGQGGQTAAPVARQVLRSALGAG